MTAQLRWSIAFRLAAVLIVASRAQCAIAIMYTASIISPIGYMSAEALSISGTSIVGFGMPSSGDGGAFLLNSSTNSVVELDPAGWGAQPNDISGNTQVGDGSGPTTGGNTHAILWHGTAASLVDLNPTGFTNSYAYGVSGDNQVGQGYGSATGGPSHALLWQGTAASVIDLHPAAFAASQANGVLDDNIVGAGQTADGKSNALLWQGAAHTVVNLHPAAYPQSYANDTSADSQVGTGVFSLFPGGERHALLWHGTAASVIDLQPTGFTQTEASAIAGTTEVGYGTGTATGNKQHALLWQGSAASVLDLHSLLAGLGHSFVSSGANDIDANGVIVGYASDSTTSYAVKWTPIFPGDYNRNGVVDAADYVVWRKGLSTTYTQVDYNVWRANFGQTAGSGAALPSAESLSAAVPEPSTGILLLGAVLIGIVFRARSV